ncbi:vacuolar protein-sorting-associated protein 33-like [Citrus sinensis]|nr:vacuolar protein-sorting-associated protein 33-like [Citrus sinensis]
MAQIPNLDNAPLNLKSIREQSQRDLVNILKNIRGKKCLVIDPKLSGSLSLIVPTSTLKEYGIELRLLSAEPVQTDCAKVVYFVGPQFISMRFISSHVHDDASKGLQREYFLYFVPRRSVACEKILEEEKVHNLMTIGEYPLYMVPLDEDVLSFELDLAHKEWQVDGDASSQWHIAKAIHKLEFTFGLIPNVRAKGKASVRVAEILNRMQTEEPVSLSDMNIPEINTLVLIDREVDMVTPMCSQLTYEGLVDEFLRINNGSVELDASIMGAQQQDGKKMKVPLNSSDKLFKEIRDLNFEVVVQVLRQKATSMKQDYTEVTTMRHINLAQHLSTFTSKPSFLGQLDMEHTIIEAQSYDICFEYIEEMIHKQEPLNKVLRLLILFSVTNSGLPKKQFDYLRQGGFSSSPSFDMSQGLSSSIDKVGDGRRSLVLVVFVGGVTFAEISALRFLSAQEGMAYDVIVGTTKIISGNSLAETFSENLG